VQHIGSPDDPAEVLWANSSWQRVDRSSENCSASSLHYGKLASRPSVEQYRLSNPAQAGWLLGAIPRNECFAALFIVGCVNGLGPQILETVRSFGWANAALSTFGTSTIVWVACCAGVLLILEESSEKVHATDIVVGLALLILIAFPIGGLSWLAISVLSLYVILFSEPLSPRRRGAIILFAATVPMLWSRLLFRYFANAILSIDASLVGLLLGTSSIGNVVPFVDGSGSLIIFPYCSSLANVSLAFVSWVVISQWQRHRWSVRDLYCCLVAAASVVSVNVTRIGLMGLGQRHYSAIHNQWGDTITNLLILGLTLGICLLGVRRETDARL
jgi:hypothetical protein